MAPTIERMKKEQSKLRLGLYGPPGGGKTLTALKLAKALAGGDVEKVGVIDTENRSAAKYANKVGEPYYIALEQFTSENYIDSLQALVAEKAEVIVIDSFSHAWEGSGGILERQAVLEARNVGQGWNKVREFEKKLWSGVLSSSVHIIVTMRSRNEWHFFVDERGKKQREVVGLEPVQRKGSDYEFDVVCLMEPVALEDAGKGVNVYLTVEKSRYDEVPRGLRIPDPDDPFFEAVKDALSAGEPPEEASNAEIVLLKDLLTKEGKEERRIEDVLSAERGKNGGVLPKRFVQRAIEQSTRRLEEKQQAA